MDWLGRGIYFWEFGPYRALEWAVERYSASAVLEAKIDLGVCLNLLDREHFDRLADVYQAEVLRLQREGVRVPENTQRGAHFLDRLVIDEYCQVATEFAPPFQTVRGCFPEGVPVYSGSWILTKTQVQIAVRDGSCIRQIRRVNLVNELFGE